MESTYAELEHQIVVYGHIHLPFVRPVSNLTVANSGSVGLPFDGDPRASYLLITESIAAVRRVEYNVEREVRALLASGLPHAEWGGRHHPHRPTANDLSGTLASRKTI